VALAGDSRPARLRRLRRGLPKLILSEPPMGLVSVASHLWPSQGLVHVWAQTPPKLTHFNTSTHRAACSLDSTSFGPAFIELLVFWR
jgi:hypothetical protein